MDKLHFLTAGIPSNAKENQALVVGNSARAAKMALELKSKFKYVYLCTTDFDPVYHYQTKRKLDAAKNIAVLPGCQVVSWEGSKGQLQKIRQGARGKIKGRGKRGKGIYFGRDHLRLGANYKEYVRKRGT